MKRVIVIAAMLLTGCIGPKPPENRLTLDPQSGRMELIGHKDTHAKGVKIVRNPDGSFVMTMDSYDATNSEAVITAEAAGTAKILDSTSHLANTLAQSVAAGAVQGAK